MDDGRSDEEPEVLSLRWVDVDEKWNLWKRTAAATRNSNETGISSSVKETDWTDDGGGGGGRDGDFVKTPLVDCDLPVRPTEGQAGGVAGVVLPSAGNGKGGR